MSTIRCNFVALRQAARKTTQLYDEALAPTGLRVTQYSILSELRRHPGATISELAEMMVMDRATLGHNLRPLERDGLIRIDVGDDRRARVIVLTDAGLVKLQDAKPLWARAQRMFEAELGGDFAERLRGDLARVSAADFAAEGSA